MNNDLPGSAREPVLVCAGNTKRVRDENNYIVKRSDLLRCSAFLQEFQVKRIRKCYIGTAVFGTGDVSLGHGLF
jgi:hypothetical protein